MKHCHQALLLAAVGALASMGASASDREESLTLAVIGDWPYSQALLDNAHLLVNSVNADREVDALLHLGDIHSGSMPCTGAQYAFDYASKTGAPIPTSNPGWNQAVFSRLQQFEPPVIYVPGDNEWADCHKSKQFSSGAPLSELASVRELFFSRPGHSLGRRVRRVETQAEHFDAANPADSQFVENVMWSDEDVLFVTFNMPGGSNNDTDRWSGTFADNAAQDREVAERGAANLRWLQSAFERARRQRARAVVIALQADMWDLENGAAHLSNYTPFVRALADRAVDFARPVLVLNGDSHIFKVDQPLADPASTLGTIHAARAVPNLTRIVVEGSGVGTHWLRLSIDPRRQPAFSWSNVPY